MGGDVKMITLLHRRGWGWYFVGGYAQMIVILKGWGQSAKLKKQSRIWGKFGTAIQGYILNPCTKFPPNPTSRKVNNQELTSQHHA